MNSTLVRVLTACFIMGGVALAAPSCGGSSDTEGFSGGGTGATDASIDQSTGTGGVGGTGATGGFGGSGTGGTGAMGGSGSGGVAGGSGNGGSSGSTGTCDPSFCPFTGQGTACCMTPNGPCGVDVGMGCQTSNVQPDF